MALIQGPVTKAYISSLNFMDSRDYMKQVADVTNEVSTMVDALQLTDRVKVTDEIEYKHTENELLFKAGVIATIDATLNGASAGENILLTLTAGTNDALPIVGEIAMFANKKTGIVITVVPGTLSVTIQPFDAADILNPAGTAIAAAQSVIFFADAEIEGGDDPEVRQPQWVHSKNNVQNFKTAGEITDYQKVSAIEVVYGGNPYLMYKIQMDTFNRHKIKINNALLFGRQSVVVVDGKIRHTTQGFRPYVFGGDGTTKLTGGVTKIYSTLDKAALKDFGRKLDKNLAPDEYWGYLGGDCYANVDDAIIGLDGVKYSIDFSSFGSADPKKRAVDLGFDSYRIYGRTYHLNKIKQLDHKGLFGAAGFDFASEGYFMPTDKIKIDGGSGVSDRILLRVMSGDGTNFYPHMETVTGKLAPTPTNTKSVLHISYQTMCGLQVVGTDHFAVLYKS
jgi:hypothetical protein